MIFATDHTAVYGSAFGAFVTFAVAFLVYRTTKQKTDVDSIRAQIADGQAAMKNSQEVYETTSKFSERQNSRLRIDLDAANAKIDDLNKHIDKLHEEMLADRRECDRKLDGLAAEVRKLKASRHE